MVLCKYLKAAGFFSSPDTTQVANMINDLLLGNMKSTVSTVPGRQDTSNGNGFTICHPNTVFLFVCLFVFPRKQSGLGFRYTPQLPYYYSFFKAKKKNPVKGLSVGIR